MFKNCTIFNQFITERNLSPKSVASYETSLKNYCQFQELGLEQLLQEADQEEEDGIRLKRRTLKQRLLDYRTYLIDNFSKNTYKTRFGQVVAFYTHFEIEIPKLPYLNSKAMKISEPITYDDMLTKEIIADAVTFANPMVGAMILLGASSGMGRREILNLTVKDFLDACEMPYEEGNIKQTLLEMWKSEEIFIPTFKLKRQKVNEYYYTFATHEFVEATVKYLLQSNKPIHSYNQLFDISDGYFNRTLQDLNDLLGLGKVGNYNRLRSHMIRKFQATALKNGAEGMSEEDIDFLQGRSRGSVRELYMKENPLVLKEKYVKAMNNVLIFHESKIVEEQTKEIENLQNQLDYVMSLLNTFDVNMKAL